MESLQTVCIALIQGVTEFLPISSSAHIQFPSLLLGWEDQGLHFDVAVHAGSLLAVLLYFRRRLLTLTIGTFNSLRNGHSSEDLDLAAKLIIATIPVLIAGFLFRDIVAVATRDLSIIVFTTLLFGLLLGLADWRTHRLRKSGHIFEDTNPSLLAALAIGCAQIFALVPGTSRSGVTITAALLLGLGRTQATTFSFLLAIPVILGAFVLTLYDMNQLDASFDFQSFGIGFLVAVISAYLCIDFFLKVIEKIGMWPFVVYRLVIGVLLGLTIWL
ncbi:MAG: undecaprenyl-diphosphate phosphatase [Gammaproteobacteria bacterium]|nr:undecaprenyl-diphosphate phosphatase [Gammaproteobacteria bacterium]